MNAHSLASDLSPAEALFAEAIQVIDFGYLERLQVRGGQLVLDPWPSLVLDIKFAASSGREQPVRSSSEIPPQIAEFFACVREIDIGEVRKLRIHHGLPFAMEVEIPGGRRG